MLQWYDKFYALPSFASAGTETFEPQHAARVDVYPVTEVFSEMQWRASFPDYKDIKSHVRSLLVVS